MQSWHCQEAKNPSKDWRQVWYMQLILHLATSLPVMSSQLLGILFILQHLQHYYISFHNLTVRNISEWVLYLGKIGVAWPGMQQVMREKQQSEGWGRRLLGQDFFPPSFSVWSGPGNFLVQSDPIISAGPLHCDLILVLYAPIKVFENKRVVWRWWK